MNWKPLAAVAVGLGVFLQATAFVSLAADAPSAPTANADAEKTWAALAAQQSTPDVPEAWRKERPAPAEIDTWRGPESERLLKLGDAAADFAKNHPADANRAAAYRKAAEAYFNAVRLGRPEADAKLASVDESRLKDDKLAADEKLQIRIRQIQRNAQGKMAEGQPAAMKAFLEGARSLQKEFPDRSEPYRMMVMAVNGEDPTEAKPVLTEIMASTAPDEVKQQVKAILGRMDLAGKPLELQFTASDGRAVDVQKMKGSVVLIDFWATWCGPCMRKLPEVKAVYEKLHGPKFEIIGIDLDDDKEKLDSFLKESAIPWPQYFDGKGWQNAIAQKYGISSIPTMWLVDRKGILREMEVVEGLEEKVTKLMAESD